MNDQSVRKNRQEIFAIPTNRFLTAGLRPEKRCGCRSDFERASGARAGESTCNVFGTILRWSPREIHHAR
jgi:hypothetical protein